MDPTETLIMMLEALDRGDREEACEHMDSLSTWLKMNGFCPAVQEAIRRVNASTD